MQVGVDRISVLAWARWQDTFVWVAGPNRAKQGYVSWHTISSARPFTLHLTTAPVDLAENHCLVLLAVSPTSLHCCSLCAHNFNQRSPYGRHRHQFSFARHCHAIRILQRYSSKSSWQNAMMSNSTSFNLESSLYPSYVFHSLFVRDLHWG